MPLLREDPDVPLDLQGAFVQIYDTLHYDRAIDYAVAPEVRLTASEARWVAEGLGL